MPTGLADRCLAADHDLVVACREHPFVVGLGDGTLPRDRFVHYVGQDAVFLTGFARAYALALAKAPDVESMRTVRALLDGVFEELELHDGYARSWGAPLDPVPDLATQRYTDFLLRVAWSEPLGSVLAAVTPCMRLYADLGAHLAPSAAPDGPYRDWVDTYASDDFAALAGELAGLLDEHGHDEDTVAAHHRTAMRCELDFFEGAWRS